MEDLNLSNVITNSDFANLEYSTFVAEIKNRIKHAQVKASLSVNVEMIKLYWSLGQSIVEKQKLAKWGDGFIRQLELDIKIDMPNIKGFSRTNLLYMRKFYLFYFDSTNLTKVQQLVGQIPWGHHMHILDKIKDRKIAIQYLQMTLQYGWSRIVLDHQIDWKTHLKSEPINNFKLTIPDNDSDFSNQILKDEYHFDFITVLKNYKEKELETELVTNITKFLLELGKGFAYVGRQYKATVGKSDFYFDLLFYHLKLKRYIVIELKVGELDAGHVGQLAGYTAIIDEQIKASEDLPTIGLLLVSKQNRTMAKLLVNGWRFPLGIAEYKLSHPIEGDIEESMPTLDELNILNNIIANTSFAKDVLERQVDSELLK